MKSKMFILVMAASAAVIAHGRAALGAAVETWCATELAFEACARSAPQMRMQTAKAGGKDNGEAL